MAQISYPEILQGQKSKMNISGLKPEGWQGLSSSGAFQERVRLFVASFSNSDPPSPPYEDRCDGIAISWIMWDLPQQV